ncbi:TonB-dependent siderophore receptor [Novosphingobium sp.]|jgi:iron complex outermembrane receptor protein|uniref:TonB-dependent siderophore receptor n=1 Tax=Novosphingobium sp. TaxID=1874826 RepID=UPI002FDF6C48
MLTLIPATVAAASLAASPAAAAEAPTGAGRTPARSEASTDEAQTGSEIVVSGQREQYVGEVPARDVPQNIQTINAATLARTGTTRLSDALDMVSGISRQNSFGGLWDSYAVRGFAGEINVPSGFLVNGFNYGRGFGGPRDLSGVERIDVLKGPTSALFGRGEPGGTVNIVTLKPQFSPTGSATVQAGSYDSYRAEADYTGPLSDSLAIRINGAVEDMGSFRDYVKTEKQTISPSLLWRLGDDTSLSYMFAYTHQEIPLDRGVLAVNGKLGVIPASRFLGEPADGPTRTNDYGHQLQVQHDFGSDWSALVGFGYRTTDLTGFSTWPELVASRQPIFTDGRTLSRQRRYYDYNTSDLTVRGEITGKIRTGGIVHHIMLGADYDRFVFDNRLYRSRPPLLSTNPTFDELYAIDIFDPVYRPADQLPATTAVIYNQRERAVSSGIYFQDQIDLLPRLKARVGVRYDDYRQSIAIRATGATTHQHQTAFSPQAGLVYEPTDTVSLYVSYGQGFRANTGNDFAGKPFDPENTESFEAGAKYASRDGRITASLAAFTMTKDNILTADPVHQGSAIAIGQARSKGVEFDASARLPAGLRILASASYVDAYATSDVLDPDFGKVVAAGDPLINIPKFSANALVFEDFEIAGHAASLGLGVNRVGKRMGETGTTFMLPGYTLVRALASFDVTDRLRLNAEVNNLFDRTWYANSYAALWVYPGAPRTFTVRLRYQL